MFFLNPMLVIKQGDDGVDMLEERVILPYVLSLLERRVLIGTIVQGKQYPVPSNGSQYGCTKNGIFLVEFSENCEG